MAVLRPERPKVANGAERTDADGGAVAELPSYLALPLDQQVETFLAHWLGPPSQAEQPVADARPDVHFPEPLRRHHATLARWEVPINRTCRLLHPSDVGIGDVEPPEVTVFLEEEQGVQEWGFDDALHVWTREVEDGEPWMSTGADLRSFLVGYELAEWAMGGSPVSAASAWMTPEQATAVVAPLVELPVPLFGVRNSPHRLYGSDDVLALVGANPFGDETPETAAGWEVWVSGRRPGVLDWLADLESVVGTEGWHSLAQLRTYRGIVWDALRLR